MSCRWEGYDVDLTVEGDDRLAAFLTGETFSSLDRATTLLEVLEEAREEAPPITLSLDGHLLELPNAGTCVIRFRYADLEDLFLHPDLVSRALQEFVDWLAEHAAERGSSQM